MASKTDDGDSKDDDDEEPFGSKETAQDEEADVDKNSYVKSLLREIANQQSIISQRDETIDALKADLVREKSMNDVLLDHIIVLKRFTGKNSSLDLSDTSDDDDKDCHSPTRKQSQLSFSSPITPAQRTNAEKRSESHQVSADDKGDTKEPNDAVGSSPAKEEGETDKDKPKEDQDTSTLAPLHESDIKRAKKLSYILNNLKSQPANKTTLIFGDSNYRYVYGELDPEGKSVAVRNVSGLCVVGAAYALKRYEHCYSHIKKVVWSLGVNDFLHENQHCSKDWTSHLSSLFSETERIFKGAKVHFILPFRGLPSVPSKFCEWVGEEIKKFPQVKRHTAPNFEGNVKDDGVHLTKEGTQRLRQFLVRTFTGYRPSNRPGANQQRWGANGNTTQGRNSETRSRGFNRGFRQASSGHQIRQAPRFNSNFGVNDYRPTNLDAEFPALPSDVQQSGPTLRIPHQNNPMRDITEALAPLASMLYAQFSRRMD